MNLRPPGYEPDELPNCSTPRYELDPQGSYTITCEPWVVKCYFYRSEAEDSSSSAASSVLAASARPFCSLSSARMSASSSFVVGLAGASGSGSFSFLRLKRLMIFTIQNTTNEIHRKLMMDMIRSPIGNTPMFRPEKSSPPMMSEMSGLMMSLTSAVTMAVNAGTSGTPA